MVSETGLRIYLPSIPRYPCPFLSFPFFPTLTVFLKAHPFPVFFSRTRAKKNQKRNLLQQAVQSRAFFVRVSIRQTAPSPLPPDPSDDETEPEGRPPFGRCGGDARARLRRASVDPSDGLFPPVPKAGGFVSAFFPPPTANDVFVANIEGSSMLFSPFRYCAGVVRNHGNYCRAAVC